MMEEEASGTRTVSVVVSSHRGDMGEGATDLQEEALLQIPADSQSCEDTGSGSLHYDWIRL